MKINSLRIENFQRLRDVNVELKQPITLFCGDNDVGKTSIQDAIRIAFTGESARVDKKKDYHLLVRRGGAKNGSSVVEFDYGAGAGRAAAVIPGKFECNPPAPAALPFVLDAARFAHLEPDDRRRFLFDLMKVKVGVKDVRERMLKRGCRPDLADATMPFLRTGFEAAEKHAEEKQAEYRGRWKHITSEDYGSVKAKTWSAEKTFASERAAELKEINESITNLDEEEASLRAEIKAGELFLANKGRYDSESAGLKQSADKLALRRRELETATRAAAEYTPGVEAERQKLRDARIESQPCPSCGTLLGQKNGKFVEVKVSKKELGALEASVTKKESTLRTLEATKSKAESDYQASEAAASALAALEAAVGKPVSADDVEAKRALLGELHADLAGLKAKQRELADEAAAAERGKKATADARAAHEMVEAWGVIREAMASDGIPGELLAEAVQPINARLAESAKATEWGLPQLERDMAISVNGNPYGICGESARWRADALLAEAISNASGLKLLILDRVDVLAPARRGQLLDWCDRLVAADGYETILLFATLKAKPQLAGADVFWLQDGEVQGQPQPLPM